DFRDIFDGGMQSQIISDLSGNRAETGVRNSGDISWSRQLESGAALSAGLAVDLVNLLTMGGASSMGLAGDASISIPLMRGSGRHIVTEPLTQAERNVVYSMYTFERFKKTFAIGIATDYLGVLNRLDSVKNSEENYRSLVASARRSRRLADAGSLTVLQVDQAVQSELRARNGWIGAMKSYRERLDSFKISLGLPPDAMVELDREDLEELVGSTVSAMVNSAEEGQLEDEPNIPPADAPIYLVEPGYEDAGPLEIAESLALELGLDNRMDLRVTEGRVYDAQRKVVVAADRLGAELTLLGSADVGASRRVGSATSDDAKIRMDKGTYSGLLTLDLPFERTAERNLYRDSLIKLEESVRNVQQLEDQIKLAIRNELRDLQESRESIQIQAKSVQVAEKRVKSANMYLEAGRAEIRDLLEAQDSLLSAQDGLTSSVINYRVAELQLQRDMGVLRIDEKGLWQEFDPREISNEQ
ncbi:MAG: TolC family protein, partial [Planctomycetes bacterium]|nr:TolC family protein [Planctomycetota bacterium]